MTEIMWEEKKKKKKKRDLPNAEKCKFTSRYSSG
jgi:hypothetical protein